jgi:hypothetical protein
MTHKQQCIALLLEYFRQKIQFESAGCPFDYISSSAFLVKDARWLASTMGPSIVTAWLSASMNVTDKGEPIKALA